jgi:hypothetical protein
MTDVYRVVRVHAPECAEHLVLKKGDVVAFDRRQTDWEGWLWCSRPTGESGWVPEAWVRIEGDKCILQGDYNALELTVQPGEALEAVLTESGWLLAVSSKGATGWVPLECVEVVGREAT